MTERPKAQVWLAQAGLLTAIPFVLLVGPAIGYYLGSALDHRWSHAPWGMGSGIVLGLAASARLTFQLILQSQQLGSDEREDQKPGHSL